MENGDARAYLESNPNANRKAIVRIYFIFLVGILTAQILQIQRTALALEFLHTQSPPILHGRVRAVRLPANTGDDHLRLPPFIHRTTC